MSVYMYVCMCLYLHVRARMQEKGRGRKRECKRHQKLLPAHTFATGPAVVHTQQTFLASAWQRQALARLFVSYSKRTHSIVREQIL